MWRKGGVYWPSVRVIFWNDHGRRCTCLECVARRLAK
jgi:hypothetical protein